MCGRTPPWATVAFAKKVLSSSSFLTARRINLGVTLNLLLSFAALPASSSTSAHKYSITAATYTGAPAPTLAAYLPYLMYLATLPTGKVIPAL